MLLLALHLLVEQIYCNFCELCSLNSPEPYFLSDALSFKKNQNKTKSLQDILKEHLQNSELLDNHCQLISMQITTYSLFFFNDEV